MGKRASTIPLTYLKSLKQFPLTQRQIVSYLYASVLSQNHLQQSAQNSTEIRTFWDTQKCQV